MTNEEIMSPTAQAEYQFVFLEFSKKKEMILLRLREKSGARKIKRAWKRYLRKKELRSKSEFVVKKNEEKNEIVEKIQEIDI